MTEKVENEDGDGAESFRIDGPIRRNAGMLSILAVSFILAPILQRFLDDYRGVIIEIKDEQVLVAFNKKPPQWLDAVLGAELGKMVQKNRGEWRVGIESPTSDDRETQILYRRYTESYQGEIVEIRPPIMPGAASVAVVKRDGQAELLELELWAEHLATAAEGKRITKTKFSWDPVLDGEEPPSKK